MSASLIFTRGERLGYVPGKLLHHVHANAQTYSPKVAQRSSFEELAVAERPTGALLRERDLNLLALLDDVWVLGRIAVFKLRKDPCAFFCPSMRHAPAWAVGEHEDLEEETEGEDGLETCASVSGPRMEAKKGIMKARTDR